MFLQPISTSSISNLETRRYSTKRPRQFRCCSSTTLFSPGSICWERSFSQVFCYRRFLVSQGLHLPPVSSCKFRNARRPTVIRKVRRYRRIITGITASRSVFNWNQDIFNSFVLTLTDFTCELRLVWPGTLPGPTKSGTAHSAA